MQNSTTPARRITILGAGAWGTAVAIALAARHDVLLWARNPAMVEATRAAGENTDYLPGFPCPAGLSVTSDLNQAID